MVGDLNEWFPGAVGRTLRRELSGPRIRRTHPAPLPIFPLDRIYWDRGLGADGFHVHRSRLARVASDHLPVVARLRLISARRPDRHTTDCCRECRALYAGGPAQSCAVRK